MGTDIVTGEASGTTVSRFLTFLVHFAFFGADEAEDLLEEEALIVERDPDADNDILLLLVDLIDEAGEFDKSIATGVDRAFFTGSVGSGEK